MEGDFESEHKGRRGGVMVEGKGSKGGGVVDESACLSFVVQMLLVTVKAGEAHDWWVGLNCKVHLRLMAVSGRL